ncbi:type II toxin-antitoxin system RelE/ParE family toxin [Actinopolymorpha sp. B11F2]|uniref:type II toxin-antitoxin system RelE family toxin n=1 Tax=Actinopolymorpha sp. B11F2 TaxID=3160862 RepID=UPI0032E3E2DD
MRVQFHPDVSKQLQRLPRPTFARVLNTIITLGREPRPSGVKKLLGSTSGWRIRIGEYRILYEIDDSAGTVTVYSVAHRRESYR